MGEYSRHHLYTVDLNKPMKRYSCGILLATGDYNGDDFTFALNRDGVAYGPEALPYMYGYFTRPDGVTVQFDKTNLTEDGTFALTLDKKCYECEGRFTLSVQMECYPESAVTIAIIDGFIRRTATGTIVYPDAEDGEEESGGVSWATVPDYWQSHIDERVNDANVAMASAAGNRSAFLYYTDAHWTGSYQQGVKLLKYLCMNTPIKKVIFGGDIIEKESDLAYVDEWREQVAQLPWHHSVAGNHDDSITDDGGENDRWGIAEAYDFLLKPEATGDVVRGDKLYYHIDDTAERTRYLFLDTASGEGNILNDTAQREWLKNTLLSTPANWHIVVVGHIWRTYSGGADAGWGSGAKIALDMLDAYNARTGEYAACTGKVEFCIGGHCHWDADHASDGGIPVILTECESYYSLRSGLNASKGSITESSVNAIVADYAAGVVKVVRVGRGASRTVNLTGEVVGGEDAWKTTTITRLLQTSDDTVAIEWSDNESGVTYVVYDNGVEVARKTNHTQAVIFNVAAGNHVYTVRPQKSDSDVGNHSAGKSITTVADVGFTNVIRTSTENGGSTLYNGGYGYKENTRISSSQVDTAATGWDCTGFFGMKRGDVVRFRNLAFMDMDGTGGSTKRNKFMYYSSDYAYVNESISTNPESPPGSEWSPVYGTDGNIVQLTIPSSVATSVVFARLIASNIDAFSIVTVNEEINITE